MKKWIVPSLILFGFGLLQNLYAVAAFEVFELGLEPGHSHNSADFEAASTRDVMNQRILNPAPRKSSESSEVPDISSRAAYTLETFTIDNGNEYSGQSHTVRAYAEKAFGRSLVVGGNQYTNIVNSEAFAEGMLVNYNLGAFAKYYLDQMGQPDLNIMTGVNLVKYDGIYEDLVNSSLGYQGAIGLLGTRQISNIFASFGTQVDYFMMGDMQNLKWSIASQGKSAINNTLSLGANVIYTRTLYFFDSVFRTETDDLTNLNAFTIGLVADYGLTESFVLAMSLDQTLSLNRHSNLVIGVGSEFGF